MQRKTNPVKIFSRAQQSQIKFNSFFSKNSYKSQEHLNKSYHVYQRSPFDYKSITKNMNMNNINKKNYNNYTEPEQILKSHNKNNNLYNSNENNNNQYDKTNKTNKITPYNKCKNPITPYPITSAPSPLQRYMQSNYSQTHHTHWYKKQIKQYIEGQSKPLQIKNEESTDQRIKLQRKLKVFFRQKWANQKKQNILINSINNNNKTTNTNNPHNNNAHNNYVPNPTAPYSSQIKIRRQKPLLKQLQYLNSSFQNKYQTQMKIWYNDRTNSLIQFNQQFLENIKNNIIHGEFAQQIIMVSKGNHQKNVSDKVIHISQLGNSQEDVQIQQQHQKKNNQKDNQNNNNQQLQDNNNDPQKEQQQKKWMLIQQFFIRTNQQYQNQINSQYLNIKKCLIQQ